MLKGLAERSKTVEMFSRAYDDYYEGRYGQAVSKYLYLATQGYEIAQYNAAFILENRT